MSLPGDDYETSSVHKFQDYLVYTCASCKETHFAQLPVQKDFDVGWHNGSGRLEQLFRHHDSSCVFVNCRNDTFFRTVSHKETVRWYFQPPRCARSLVCDHTADQLERYYGPFLLFHSNDNSEPLFKGYKCHKMNDGTEFTYFCGALYNTLEYEAQRTRGVCATSQSETQRHNTFSLLTENEIERCSNELRSKYMLKEPTQCASSLEHSPSTFSPTECLDKHRSALQSLNTDCEAEGLLPTNANLHSIPSSEHSRLNDRTNLDVPHEEDMSLRNTELTDGHQQSRTQGRNERDVFDYREHESEITSHEGHVAFQGETHATTVAKQDFRQYGFPECQIDKRECDQQNHQETIVNSSHEDSLNANQNSLACNDLTDHRFEGVSRRSSEVYTPKEQLIELPDNKNKVSYRDGCDHQKHLDTIPTGQQHSKQHHETSTFFTDNKVSSNDEQGRHEFPNDNKANSNSVKFTSGCKEDRRQTAFSEPLYTHQSQDDPLPNSELNAAHTPSTSDLSAVKCLRLNPGISVDSLAADRKYFNQKENHCLPNSNDYLVPTPSTPDLSNVEDLQLNPGKIIDSCCEVTSDDLAQESILPLNAEPKLKDQRKQSDYTSTDCKTARDVETTLRNNTMEYKTKPQEPDKPSRLDSVKTLATEVLSGQYARNKKVFSDIQNSFCTWYLDTTNWKKRFPFFYPFHRLPTSAVFDFTVEQDGSKYPSRRNIFSEMNSCSRKEILILGSPGFGKTTLCTMIAYRWASGVCDLSKLCIHCPLPKITDLAEDILEAIIIYCKLLLGGKVFDLESIREALKKYSEDILLLLDGFDQLPENRKKDVCNFLKRKDVFSESIIAVTSRPRVDKNFTGLFDKLVHINGFSAYSLRKSMKSIEVPEVMVTRFMSIIQENKLDYLSELSPLFTLNAAKIIRDSAPDLNVFHSLYSLLRKVIIHMVSGKISETIHLYNCMELLQFVGKKCFEHLLFGRSDFDEEFLKETLGGYFDLLLGCNLFYVLPDKENTRKYRTSGKVLQVFLATMYLRELWSKTNNRELFLKETYCANNCSGDFVKEGRCLYYVGLIPEIVLKIGEDLSLQNASFEMYHDVERVEHSHAFDSVNLLLRVTDEFLARYRFLRCPEDDEVFVERFGEVLNMIPTETFSVQHFFYTNRYEKRDFVVIVLRQDEEPDAVLHEVVRAKSKGTVDRIYLDFVFAKLEGLFPFISAQLSRYLNQFSLYSNLKYGTMEDFVFELVVQLLECRNLRAAVVRCQGSVDPVRVSVKISCTFQITRHHDENISRVSFSFEGMRAHIFYGNSEVFDQSEFFKNKSRIKAFIKDCKISLDTPSICIDILPK